MSPHPAAWLAPLAWSTDRLVAAIDLVGLGATLGGVGTIVTPVLLFLTQRRSTGAAGAATAAAVSRREITDAQAAELAQLRSQFEMQSNLVAACPVRSCPVRTTLQGTTA